MSIFWAAAAILQLGSVNNTNYALGFAVGPIPFPHKWGKGDEFSPLPAWERGGGRGE